VVLSQGNLRTNPYGNTRQSFCITVENDELMKKNASLWLFILAMSMTLSSCEVIGGIFKAGFWTAIIIVVIVVLLILWLVGRSRK
jgi:ABC-type multidrug transport system permease subunit